MSYPFKKIAIAYSFSPQSEYLFAEASRIIRVFQAEVIIIHAGEKTPEKENALEGIGNKYGLHISSRQFLCEKDTTKRFITKMVREQEIDLLIMGALNKENGLPYYKGSVARQIMREPPCSCLVIPSDTAIEKLSFDKIIAVINFSPESETFLRCGYHFAKKMSAQEITLVREVIAPGLAMTVHDGGSANEAELMRLQWKEEEEMKLELLLREMNIHDMKIETLCLYGKQGWAVAGHAREAGTGILITQVPSKNTRLIDRLLPQEQEYVLGELPCPLLMMKL